MCAHVRDISAKEPYISAKEPYISAKEPYVSSKEPFLSVSIYLYTEILMTYT